jgi:hypothetical protein
MSLLAFDGANAVRHWRFGSDGEVGGPPDLTTGMHHVVVTWDGTTRNLYLDGGADP